MEALRRRSRFPLCALALVVAAIQPGAEEWIIGEVHFVGNDTIPRKQLLGAMRSDPPFLWRRTEYSFPVLQGDLAALGRLYANRGRPLARVWIEQIERDTSKHSIMITLAIEEGPLITIDTIVFSGNRVYPDSAFPAMIEVEEGDPLTPRQLDAATETIEKALADDGHLFARAEYSRIIDTTEAKARVTVSIREGPLITVDSIRVVGLEAIIPYVMRRELTFEPGDTLRRSLIRRSTRRIYATGLAAYVRIRAEIEQADTAADTPAAISAPVVVEIDEVRFWTVDASVGYGTEEELRTSLLLSYDNLFARGHRAGIYGKWSQIFWRGEANYSTPWLFVVPLNTQLSVFIEDRDDPESFTGRFWGTSFEVGQQPAWFFSYRAGVKVDFVNFVEEPDPGEFPDVPTRNTQSLVGGVRFDFRENLFNPRRGVFAAFDGELAGLGGSNTNQFYRGIGDIRGYIPVADWLRVASGVNGGYVAGYGSGEDFVPPQERFYFGRDRLRPVRGLDEDDVTPDGGALIAMLLNLIELRFPLYWWFHGAVFVDAGAGWQSLDEIALGDLLWSAGPGLRVQLPLGMISVDVGFALNGPAAGSAGFHLWVGQPF